MYSATINYIIHYGKNEFFFSYNLIMSGSLKYNQFVSQGSSVDVTEEFYVLSLVNYKLKMKITVY